MFLQSKLSNTHCWLVKDWAILEEWLSKQLKLSNSAGVCTLISKEYKIWKDLGDSSSGFVLAVLEKEDFKICVVNVYCPNNHSVAYVWICLLWSKSNAFKLHWINQF